MSHRIIIRKVEQPRRNRIEEEARWIFDSLGLMSGRDIEDTSFKIMFELLDLFSEDRLVSTEDVARSLGMESPRINHHIRSFMESGIILREKRKIALNGGSLTRAIEEMKRDSENMFNRLIEASKKIDHAFELDRINNRKS